MRTLYRFLVAGALSAPLVIGAAGIASADTHYHHSSSAAGPDGAWNYCVVSGTDGHGGTYYHENLSWAGPQGAYTSDTHASAGDNHGDHEDDD
ncbi:hypothetical protein [Saccharothrix algeriensis]|uniref:Secreted protein n=1 Tax=Saccharothrix algeriensis TaxID=173560 RepID=A0ABS2SDM1_9PSEU|nr:hypothetical protein [Saccharothrix algeriensis]MBM7814370.1 hypothetical protein [Saccharothrix algeriensis]